MLYKLTNQDFTTYGGCLWRENVTHTADGEGELCSEHWLHAYTHPLLAVFLNPIHGGFINPILWECDGIVRATDHWLKVGCTSLTTLRQIPLHMATTEQRIRFAIACALSVYQESSFVAWATDWISGTNRSEKAAQEMWASAWMVPCATEEERIAAWGAIYAVRAAKLAAEFEDLATESLAIPAAESVEWAAQSAKKCATKESRKITLDLITCAEWAMCENTVFTKTIQ